MALLVSAEGDTRARFPKFVIRGGTFAHELRGAKGTSKLMFLVPLFDLRSLNAPAALVSRFRRSYSFSAPAFTNVGTKGTLALIGGSEALDLTFLLRTRRKPGRNVKSAALVQGPQSGGTSQRMGGRCVHVARRIFQGMAC